MKTNEIDVQFSSIDSLLEMTITGHTYQIEHMMMVHDEAFRAIFPIKVQGFKLNEELAEKYKYGENIPSLFSAAPQINVKVESIPDSFLIKITLYGRKEDIYIRLMNGKQLWSSIRNLT